MKETKQYKCGDHVIANPETIDFDVVDVAGATGTIIQIDRYGNNSGYVIDWDNRSVSRYNWYDHELFPYPIINRLGVLMLLKD